jgi:catechol 2,3-dioxygenase-like lactoylglutathione lyase family enzyme
MRRPFPSQRRFAGLVLVVVFGAACAPRSLPARRPLETPLVTAVATVGMTVADVARAVDFYTRVLDFALISDVEVAGTDVERLDGVPGARKRVARMRLGDETIELTEYRVPRGRPIPPDARSNDRTFQHVAIVTSDMGRAYRRLRQNHVRQVSSAPQRLPDWNPNAGGIEAFYFADPDGHALEAIRFPPGKGAPKWRCPRAAHTGTAPSGVVGTTVDVQPPCPLFQGIDHTAIVVADTARSLEFYRDLLGLEVAGESHNWGPEQEALNAVAGARLRITGLRAAAGPGVELLEYLAPRDGRPAPADLAANDLAHWETTFTTSALGDAARRLGKGGAASPPTVGFVDASLGFSAATVVRDPDGHALRLITR